MPAMENETNFVPKQETNLAYKFSKNLAENKTTN